MNRPIAELSRRAAAALIDVAIPVALVSLVWILLAVIDAVRGDSIGAVIAPLWAAVTLLGWIVVLGILQGGRGSPGMRLLGLRLIGADNLRPIGFVRALLRLVVWLALCAVVIGFFTVFWDRSGNRQGWHDRVANAITVQRPKRTPIMPPLPQSDSRTSEWLAAMSMPALDGSGQINEVPISEPNHAMTTADPPVRTTSIIDMVPGVTLDRLLLADRFAAVAPPHVPLVVVPRGGHDDVIQQREVPAAPPQVVGQTAAGEEAAAPLGEPIRHAASRPTAERLAVPARATVPSMTMTEPVRTRADSPRRAAARAAAAAAAVEASIRAEQELAPAPEPPQDSAAGAVAPDASVVAAVHAGIPPRAALPVVPVAETGLSEEEESTAVSEPPASVAARAVHTQRSVATLIWDDGTHYRIYGRTVFGRNPTPVESAQLAMIHDQTMSLSKTHFEISRTEDDRAALVDLHSTNGVVLHRGRQAQTVAPGEPILLESGDIIEIARRRARVEVTG